jgi:proline dehydrogenase
MYKGEPTLGLEFYELLFHSEEFASELGKVTLASSRLEAEIILFLKRKGIEDKYEKATLGKLIDILKRKNLVDNNLIIALKQVSMQRNYLTHNIYSLFTDLLEETILEKHNLLDSDVHTYVERAWQLKTNLIALSEIFEKEGKKNNRQ